MMRRGRIRLHLNIDHFEPHDHVEIVDYEANGPYGYRVIYTVVISYSII